MLLWGPLILILSGLFAAGTSFYLHQETNRLKFLGFFLAAGVFVVIEIATLLSIVITGGTADYITTLIGEWGKVYCIALTLSSLLLFIRDSKPEFSQFPILYGALPFVILISYLLVLDSLILKHWLLNIYKGGASLVGLLMYGIYSYRQPSYRILALGAFMFFVTYIVHLSAPMSFLVWQLLLALSVVTFFGGYLFLEEEYI